MTTRTAFLPIAFTLFLLGAAGCGSSAARASGPAGPNHDSQARGPDPAASPSGVTPNDQESDRDMKILIVLTSHEDLGDTGRKTGFFLSEVSHTYYVFRDAGASVVFASVRGGKAPIDGMDRKDARNLRLLEDQAVMAALSETVPLDQVDPAGFDAVFYPGGHGTMWDFPGNPEIQRITSSIWEKGGIVAAVCHGPAALTEIRLSDGSYLVAGHRVAAFTNEEEHAMSLEKVVPFLLQDRLAERGAKVEPAAKFEANVIVSDRLITGQNPASAHGLAEEIVRALQRR